MKIVLDMPTPKACVDCRFHTVETDGRSGPWVMRCLIDRDIKVHVSEGVDKRNNKCPGNLESEDDNDWK